MSEKIIKIKGKDHVVGLLTKGNKVAEKIIKIEGEIGDVNWNLETDNFELIKKLKEIGVIPDYDHIEADRVSISLFGMIFPDDLDDWIEELSAVLVQLKKLKTALDEFSGNHQLYQEIHTD